MVQRTLARMRQRRLSMDDEGKVQTSETLRKLALIQLMVMRVAQGRTDMKKRHVLMFSAVCLMVALGGAYAEAQLTDFHDDLSFYNQTLWQKATWANPFPFDCTFAEDNVTHINGKLKLEITEDGAGSYSCAEYQSLGEYGYGTYSARIKAASGPGVVTGFFVYTGDWGQSNHHEIDFEFLGKKPWKVQLNYFVAGIGRHETKIDLGFDASAGYHTYTFKWSSSQMKWLVDGTLVHTVSTAPMPSPPAKLMVNLWNGDTSAPDIEDWLEPFVFDPNTPIQARVEWIEFTEAP
jgi:beta-glucanase (GH16 family)